MIAVRPHLVKAAGALCGVARAFVRFGRAVAAAVGAEDRAEEPKLVPAHYQLAHVRALEGRCHTAAVTTHIRSPPGDAAERGVYALRHLRGELLKRGPNIRRPEDDAMALPTGPHAARQQEWRFVAEESDRLSKSLEPRVDPELRVDARGPIRRVIPVVTIADARALAVGFVEPVCRDALVVVPWLEELPPYELTARGGRCVDGAAAQVGVD